MPAAYKSFSDHYAESPYATAALRLQAQPRLVPVLQPTHLMVPPQLASRPIKPVSPPLKTIPTPILRGNANPPPSRIVANQPPHIFQSNPHPFRSAMTTTHPIFARSPGRFRLDSGPHFAQSGSPRMMGSSMGHGGGHGFR